jgi:hypothetical protein
MPLAPSFYPSSPLLPDRNFSALFSNFVGVDINNNKKDKVFLLVEIRIAIQRDS